MTLPVYPATITLSDIRTEFGNVGQINLSDYYAGGTNVPLGSIGYPGGVATQIPTSGPISIHNFYGLTDGAIVTNGFDGDFIASLSVSPANAISTYTFNTDGTTSFVVSDLDGASATSTLNWYSPTTASIGNSFYIRATVTSHTPTYVLTGATGTWLQLNSPRSWTLTNSTGPNVQQAVILFEISTNSSGTSIITSGSVTLDAERA